MSYQSSLLPLYRRRRAVGGFSPFSLFANGEQGVWYQNSDFSTLFQDAAGTTPVTALEQPVGLRLDKSKGLVLGSELVTNGDFSNGTTGWTTTGGYSPTVSGGVLVFNGGSNTGGIYQSCLTVGKVYQITYTIVTRTSGAFKIGAGTTYGPLRTAAGTYTETRQAIGDGLLRVYGDATDFVGTIDNISVRELPGNHAFQTTNSARPVLSARVNLLTRTEEFDNAAWAKISVSISSPTVVSADEVSFPAVSNNVDVSILRQSFTSVVTSYTGAIELKAKSASDVGKKIVVYINAKAGPTFNFHTLTDSYVRVVVTDTGTATTGYFSVGVLGSEYGGQNQGACSVNIRRADLRTSSESSALPAYQRVGAAVNGTSTSIGTPDYDTVGFPAYLRYDGGDWYQTNSIDFSAGATNPPLGSDVLGGNGNFNTPAYWVTDSGCSVSGGLGVFTAALTNNGIGKNGVLTTGRWYLVTYTIVSISSGFLRPYTGAAQGTARNTTGTFTEYIQATAANIYIVSSGTTTATIDNFIVKELTDSNYAPDKMSVFAGVRKLSDAGSSNAAVILELSATSDTNNGTFVVVGSNGYVSPNYTFSFVSGGTTRTTAFTQSGSYSAPVTNIMTGLGSISGDSTVLRLNTAQISENTSDQGTGNFGNYPLYIGGRGGTTFFFTGREYSTIVLGRAVTATELANTEDYMETQTFGKNMAYVYSDELTTALGELITAADGDQIYMSVSYV